MDQLGWLLEQPPFAGLDPDDRRMLGAALQVAYLPVGARVGRAGDQPEEVWVVRRGAVRRHQPGPDVVLEEGELIGALEVLDRIPLANDHEVIEALLAYVIPAGVFRRLAGADTTPGSTVDTAPGGTVGSTVGSTLDNTGGTTPGTSAGTPAGTTVEAGPALGPLALAARRQVAPDVSGLVVTAATVAGPAHRISGAATVAEAARAMDAARTDALLVDGPVTGPGGAGPGSAEGGAGSLGRGRPGIVTAHDLLSRVLAVGRSADTPVAEVATPLAMTLDPATPLVDALVFLLEHDVHHIPLDDGTGCRLILSDDDILAHFGNDAFSLLRRLSAGAGLGDGGFAHRVERAVVGLFRADVGPAAIGRAVSSLTDGLMQSLCRQAEAELGPPPAPYALCACGSQGRREQTLLTDQDNLLVHAGRPGDGAWFDELANRVVTALVAAGIPACTGGYMATNWCGPLEWWRATVAGWAVNPDPDALLHLNILGDLRVVAGDLPEADVWAPIHAAVAGHPLLVRRLGAEVIRFRPPGRLSRLLGRGDDFDLKKHGLIPIVGLGRLFGFELGLTTASTARRLEAGAAAGYLSGEARAWLVDGLAFLTGARLRSQLRSIEATGDPGAVPFHPDDLDPVGRATLREVLRVVSDVQHATSDRLGLDAVA